jgi:hypothetical protein
MITSTMLIATVQRIAARQGGCCHLSANQLARTSSMRGPSASHSHGRCSSSLLTPVGAALPLDQVPAVVLRPVAQGDNEPLPPDEDAGQAFRKDEQ